MNQNLITTKFEKLGARAKIRPLRWRSSDPVVIDIGHDRQGEFFDIQADPDADVDVLDVQPRDRHLLLMIRRPNERPHQPDIKDKLLCGHDERHWFVAGRFNQWDGHLSFPCAQVDPEALLGLAILEDVLDDADIPVWMAIDFLLILGMNWCDHKGDK
jgi:hypothetical protein